MPERLDCDFKKQCERNEWIFGTRESRQWWGPAYGHLSRPHPMTRCPLCKRRLQVKAVYCFGGEFTNWCLPDHKPKGKLVKKSPKRATKAKGRGK